MNIFFVKCSGFQYNIFVNINGDPEALYMYNYKTFDDIKDAYDLIKKMQQSNKDLNFAYWDFML